MSNYNSVLSVDVTIDDMPNATHGFFSMKVDGSLSKAKVVGLLAFIVNSYALKEAEIACKNGTALEDDIANEYESVIQMFLKRLNNHTNQSNSSH